MANGWTVALVSALSCATMAAPFVGSARILVLMTHHAASHFAAFELLLVRLVERGHNLTIVAHQRPRNAPPHAYRYVRLQSDVSFNSSRDIRSFGRSWLHDLRLVAATINSRYEKYFLQNRQVRRLAASDERFDLVIAETFVSRIALSLVAKLKAPVSPQPPLVLVSSTDLFSHTACNVRNCLNPAYELWAHSGYTNRMNFLQRLGHAFEMWTWMVALETVVDGESQTLAAKYLDSTASLAHVERMASLILVNDHFVFKNARALPPHIVAVAGLAIKPPKKVAPDIERFINESKDGVVYFCMGSLLRGETFPAEKRNAFLTAFSKIPQRVLWKWEGDVLPGKSDDIMISKWMPQRDILAHPNVKLFISHGGLLGTSEAVYEGVPILGIPIFGDQRTNVKAIEANGAGLLLDYNDIGEEVVLEKIRAVLNDPKYKEKAKQLSDRYRDRPMSPLDTAVYWTEYVIRHKGAAHLRTAAVDMPWHQYLLLDVIAFLLVAAVSLLVVAYYACKVVARLVSTSLRRLRPRRRAQKEKRA